VRGHRPRQHLDEVFNSWFLLGKLGTASMLQCMRFHTNLVWMSAILTMTTKLPMKEMMSVNA
jgi:hypothetical protein